VTESHEVLYEVVLEDDSPSDDVSEAGRRDFLKRITGISLAGIGAATLGAASMVSTFLTSRPAMAAPKGYLVLDSALCTGCRTCMIACSTYNNDGEGSMELARLTVPRHPFHSTWETARPVNYEPRPCLQCADAPCVNVCPVGAIQTDHKSGTNARVIDQNACIGCKRCIEACESVYELPRIQFDVARNKAIKCHLCSGNPQCVSWCPNHAINYVSADDFKPGTKHLKGQVVNIENDYRIVRAEERTRELGFPQNPKPVRPQPEPS
jgi:Fe-S-cluster-containing dehydrogenase component